MAERDVEIPLPDGGALPAFLAEPEEPSRGAGILVLQEIFGINANIREITAAFARKGYVAIAPDLFWRQERGLRLDPSTPAHRERATELMKGLDQELALDDALAAANRLRILTRSPAKVAAVGYCLGGKLAFLAATRPGIDAAVSYYGVGIQHALDQAAKIRCPLLLHIAGQDHLCPPEAQEAIAQAMASHPQVRLMHYPAAGHAFARPAGQAFDAAAASEADNATAEFLERAIG